MARIADWLTPVIVLLTIGGAGGTIAARSAQSTQPTSVAIKAGRILNVRTGAHVAQQIIWIEGDWA
jgi:hypothetical protein